jgi:hypothetical protein
MPGTLALVPEMMEPDHGRSAMDQDRRHTEQFTDDELVLLRHAKFGELPAGVVPDDLIETTDTDRPHQEPQEPSVRREWGGG